MVRPNIIPSTHPISNTTKHLCCSNNITGTTVNPHNRTLTPGGSSGGEGASMGFRCAPLGIGTDIGGSIRCPAAFCGAYGFRPSSLRNPSTGIKVASSGQETIRGVVGPMSSCSIEDLELFQRAVLDQEPWDVETSLMPLPWRNVAPTRDMTVAIMWDDGYEMESEFIGYVLTLEQLCPSSSSYYSCFATCQG